MGFRAIKGALLLLKASDKTNNFTPFAVYLRSGDCRFIFYPEAVTTFDTEYSKASFNKFEKGLADRGGVVPPFTGDFAALTKRLPKEPDFVWEFRLLYNIRAIFAGIAEDARRAAG